MRIIDEDKLVKIFCDIHDFCKVFEPWIAKNKLPKPFHSKPMKSKLKASEVMTIMLFFHYSGYRNFKKYYLYFVQQQLKDYFPNLVSYNRFVELIKMVPAYFFGYINLWVQGTHTGKYFIDSSHLAVCHNKRIYSHRVFKRLATRSKTTMGWFLGLKLHIVVNDSGEIMTSTVTTGKRADHHLPLLTQLTHSLKGDLAADRGYISQKAVACLMEAGIRLITGARRNMKKYVIASRDFLHLKGRPIIEKVIGWLKNVANIWHTRHRCPVNAFVHLWAGIAAYIHADPMKQVGGNKTLRIMNNCTLNE